MSVVLYRIDERLIHGQVVVGWGHELHPSRYVVVDDELAQSPWEQDLYRLAVPDAEVVFSTVADARTTIPSWRSDEVPTVLLTRDVGSMRRLAAGGLLSGESVNLGGLHHAPGRTELLSYLYVSEQDRDDLETLASSDVEVSARDLPDAPRVPLTRLLDR